MTLEVQLERIAVALESIAANGSALNIPVVVAGDTPQTPIIPESLKKQDDPAPETAPEVPKTTRSRAKKETAPETAPASVAPAPQQITAPSPEPVAAPASSETFTQDDVRKAAHAYSLVGDREGVIAVFKKLGDVKSLKDIPEAKYAEAVSLFAEATAAKTK